MADTVASSDPRPRKGLSTLLARLAARPGLQAWAARFPLTRRAVRREGEALMRLVSGFVQSQVILALVELDVLRALMDGAQTPAALAMPRGLTPERMEALLQAGAALGLLRRRGDGRFGLSPRGAALIGAPGLEAMIRHHGAFYRDMADPVALLRGEVETELAEVWPYVFGQAGDLPEATARSYSDLMTQSQRLVAEDTLRMHSLKGVTRLMDVGGGTGAFLRAAARARPGLELMLFDLPAVIPEARRQMAAAGLETRTAFHPGSFRTDPLPEGADAISLIRVLFDHEDDTVRDLLARSHAALPPGGRLIVSEPMSGGARPDPAGDVYFAFYTMAMRTGRTRSAARIGELCREAGFVSVKAPRPPRSFVTSMVTCVKPD
ncbi:MAG: methyltransferase [Paracoccaceae bacterium]